jgi:hypothetical protein
MHINGDEWQVGIPDSCSGCQMLQKTKLLIERLALTEDDVIWAQIEDNPAFTDQELEEHCTEISELFVKASEHAHSVVVTVKLEDVSTKTTAEIEEYIKLLLEALPEERQTQFLASLGN